MACKWSEKPTPPHDYIPQASRWSHCAASRISETLLNSHSESVRCRSFLSGCCLGKFRAERPSVSKVRRDTTAIISLFFWLPAARVRVPGGSNYGHYFTFPCNKQIKHAGTIGTEQRGRKSQKAECGFFFLVECCAHHHDSGSSCTRKLDVMGKQKNG